MSSFYNEMIECPKCKNKSSFRIWKSINTQLDPEMKEKVKDGSAFTFTCPECNNQTTVDYGFLYHQMEDSIMIAYAPDDASAEMYYGLFTGKQKLPKEMENVFAEGEYITRITSSVNSLREKIIIFENGLDDRLIEFYKLLVITQISEQLPDDENIALLYSHGDTPSFEILSPNKYIGSTQFSKEAYDYIVKNMSDMIPDIRHDVPIIDTDYAMNLLKRKTQYEDE